MATLNNNNHTIASADDDHFNPDALSALVDRISEAGSQQSGTSSPSTSYTGPHTSHLLGATTMGVSSAQPQPPKQLQHSMGTNASSVNTMMGISHSHGTVGDSTMTPTASFNQQAMLYGQQMPAPELTVSNSAEHGSAMDDATRNFRHLFAGEQGFAMAPNPMFGMLPCGMAVGGGAPIASPDVAALQALQQQQALFALQQQQQSLLAQSAELAVNASSSAASSGTFPKRSVFPIRRKGNKGDMLCSNSGSSKHSMGGSAAVLRASGQTKTPGGSVNAKHPKLEDDGLFCLEKAMQAANIKAQQTTTTQEQPTTLSAKALEQQQQQLSLSNNRHDGVGEHLGLSTLPAAGASVKEQLDFVNRMNPVTSPPASEDNTIAPNKDSSPDAITKSQKDAAVSKAAKERLEAKKELSNRWKNVYIAKLPKSFTSNDLYQLCLSFGPIASLKLLVDPSTGVSRGVGFVLFETAKAAQEAVDNLDKIIIQTNDGTVATLDVRFASASATQSVSKNVGGNSGNNSNNNSGSGPHTSHLLPQQQTAPSGTKKGKGKQQHQQAVPLQQTPISVGGAPTPATAAAASSQQQLQLQEALLRQQQAYQQMLLQQQVQLSQQQQLLSQQQAAIQALIQPGVPAPQAGAHVDRKPQQAAVNKGAAPSTRFADPFAGMVNTGKSKQ